MISPITFIKTPFVEKFGVPRQSLLASATGEMIFPKTDFFVESFRGIEESSHLWLIFEFHLIPDGNFNGLVRPPRYEGKAKLGVYATRSPHRPNRLGLSVVKFESLEIRSQEILLKVSGVDLVDGTPIFDIKPYVPYADAINAKSPFARPNKSEVIWLCPKINEADLIESVIALDPRPGQDKESTEEYGVSIAGFDVKFRFTGDHFQILSIATLRP